MFGGADAQQLTAIGTAPESEILIPSAQLSVLIAKCEEGAGRTIGMLAARDLLVAETTAREADEARDGKATPVRGLSVSICFQQRRKN